LKVVSITGGEQWVALLYCVERIAPLPDDCMARDLSCKCMVGGKVLVEETEELFKKARRGDGVDRRAGVREAEVQGRSKT